MDGKEVTYGYSSGTYARLNPMFDRVSLLPRQEEIDKLGSGIGRKDWEKRFDLVYEMAKGPNRHRNHGSNPCYPELRHDTSNRNMANHPKTSGNPKPSSAPAYAKSNSNTVPSSKNTMATHPSWKCTLPPKACLGSNWTITHT